MRSMLRLGLTPFLALACAVQGYGGAPHNDSIRAADLSADLHFLAGDSMRGRLAGTADIGLAADFIKSRHERLGLQPAGSDGSFFQPFELNAFGLGSPNSLTVEGLDGGSLELGPGEGYLPLNFSATAAGGGAVVFAGFGIVEPRFSWDDYRGADVEGKLVMVLEHEPGEHDPDSVFDGVVVAEASRGWRKVLAAQERGAVGVLFVLDAHNHPGESDRSAEYTARLSRYWPVQPRRIERFSLATWMDRITIPAARISAELAGRLLESTGRVLEDLSASAEDPSFAALPVAGPEVELVVSVNRHTVPGRNVIAVLEGSDPQLRDEVVILCAHHDHNGVDDGGVYNGADDDGSGIVGLLEIAEAYALAARDGQRPRRTVMFAAWDAEERGLLGAWYYTENPLRPLENIAAVLNMDMIGRNEEVPEDGGGRFRGLEVQTADSNANAINILGYSHSSSLRSAVEAANEPYGLELKFRYDNNLSNLLRRSDHWPFLQRGVPALWFHTGLHPDYHRYGDTPDRITYAKMERIVRLVHRMSWNIAEQDERPRLDSE